MYRSNVTFNVMDPHTLQPVVISAYWYDEPTPRDVAELVDGLPSLYRRLKVMTTRIERVTEQQITDTGDDV